MHLSAESFWNSEFFVRCTTPFSFPQLFLLCFLIDFVGRTVRLNKMYSYTEMRSAERAHASQTCEYIRSHHNTELDSWMRAGTRSHNTFLISKLFAKTYTIESGNLQRTIEFSSLVILLIILVRIFFFENDLANGIIYRQCANNEEDAKNVCKDKAGGAADFCEICKEDSCNGSLQYGPVMLLIAIPVAILMKISSF